MELGSTRDRSTRFSGYLSEICGASHGDAKREPLPDEGELSRRMVQQSANVKEIIELARQIRKQAIECEKTADTKTS